MTPKQQASGISPKVIKFLSKQFRLTQPCQGKHTWSLWSQSFTHGEERDCEIGTIWSSFQTRTSIQEEWAWKEEMAWPLTPDSPPCHRTPRPNPGTATASPAAQLIQTCSVQSHQAEFKTYFGDLIKLFGLKKHHFLRVQPLIQLSVIKAFAQVWTNFSVYRTDWINIPVRGRKFITATASVPVFLSCLDMRKLLWYPNINLSFQ